MSSSSNTHQASNLLEAQQMQFVDEHQRLMRALNSSLSSKNDLYLQLRRMQESLVSVALKLQVAIKVSKDDEVTISNLRKASEESRKEALEATKQATAADNIIKSLKLEISSLKRKLKESQQYSHLYASNESDLQGNKNFTEVADAEVDVIMNGTATGGQELPLHPDLIDLLDTSTRKSRELTKSTTNNKVVTPFQVWKIQNYIKTPDMHDLLSSGDGKNSRQDEDDYSCIRHPIRRGGGQDSKTNLPTINNRGKIIV